MREWTEKHPEELKEQQKGRALWWDKAPRTLAAQKDTEASKVANKAYYYDAN